MNRMDFSVGSCIRFGWETFKQRPWFLAGVALFLAVVPQVLSGPVSPLMRSHQSQGIMLGLGVVVLSAVVGIFLKMGTIAISLKAHDSISSTRFSDLWAPQTFWSFVGASIVVGLIVALGTVLLIVPGIIWGLRYMFVLYIVIEQKLGVSKALTESWRITKGHTWRLFLFSLALIGINILGAMCLVVGLLVTIPVSYLAMAHAYRTLSGNSSSVAL